MSVLITSDETSTTDGRTYRTIEMTTGKQSLCLMLVSGASEYVQVMVQNASHSVWRGMGKRFESMELAIASYKSSAVKAMLSSVL